MNHQDTDSNQSNGAIAFPSLPPKPVYVVQYNIETALDFNDIHRIINMILEDIDGAAFEYITSQFYWTCSYARGSTHCKFEVRLYRDVSGKIVIEVNRLLGDSFSFFEVYQQLKKEFIPVDLHQELHIDSCLDKLSPMPGISDSLSDQEAAEALKPILEMASEPNQASQMLAAEILCDLSSQNDMHNQLYEQNAIQTLVKLATEINSETTLRLLVIAISNLSKLQSFQHQIVQSDILPLLFSLAIDGTYETAEKRRSCARIIANVSSNSELAPAVVEKLDRIVLSTWIDGIDTLQDMKLKKHAIIARDALSAVITL